MKDTIFTICYGIKITVPNGRAAYTNHLLGNCLLETGYVLLALHRKGYVCYVIKVMNHILIYSLIVLSLGISGTDACSNWVWMEIRLGLW